MNEVRPCKIYLLNGDALQVGVSPKLYAEELLSIIADHCNIQNEDKKYFGLAYKDDRDQCYWLPNERLVLGREIDQELNESEHFKAIYHYIKFYPSSFDSINEPSTLLWFFYDLRLRFLRGQLFVSLENFAKCCACLINISSKEDQEGLNIIDIFHTNIIYSSCQVLKVYDIDMADLEQAIIKETENFHNYSQAKLLSIFLSMALNSITYGCYFYDVTDKNTGLKLAINSKGITELDSGLLRTKKVFYWRQLDNLYYRGHIFTIEVRSADSFESEHSMDASMSQANFSKLQTHLVLNKVQHFTYYCESVNLCKAIWSLAIAQHQFFLDEQMSNKIYDNHSLYEVNLKELTDKLNRILSQPTTSFNHRIPSIDKNPMPSAKVADGSTSSCKNIPMTAICKTEEDRQRDIALYKTLLERKNDLEEKLLSKLEELKSVCISEGEIIGELPKEIYRTLMPGEPEPKIKKRVGTSFKLPQEILDGSYADDKAGQLEADIELHRKIVAAAERLAKDKSTNKSVRKKRRKDLQAAAQKLRGLEKGLHKLRLSSSKPDVTSLESHSTGSIFSLNSLKGWPSFAHSSFRFGTKSCPTTPRGSVPDLSSDSSDKSFIAKILNKSITPNKNCVQEPSSAPVPTFSMASSRASSRDPSPFPFLSESRNHEFSTASTSRVDSNRNSTEYNGHLQANEKRPQDLLDSSFIGSRIPLSIRDAPIYANVGYKTSAPYTSAYRQLNYPTLHEQQPETSHLIPRSTGFSSTQHYSTPQLRAPEPSVKPMTMSNSATNFGIKRPETYLPTATNSHFGIKLEANDAYTSDVPSMASIANSELGMIVKKMNGTTNQEHLRNHSPSRWLSQPAYSTGSLDRRILRARQALHQNGGSQESPLKNNGISSTSNGKVLTTTFPAGAMTDGGVIETTRPLESSDILKYRSSSQNHHHENMKSISASAIHPNRLYSANINGTHWNQNLSHTKDPRMEALLEHYKTANNNTSPISKPAVASSNTSNPKAATMV